LLIFLKLIFGGDLKTEKQKFNIKNKKEEEEV